MKERRKDMKDGRKRKEKHREKIQNQNRVEKRKKEIKKKKKKVCRQGPVGPLWQKTYLIALR